MAVYSVPFDSPALTNEQRMDVDLTVNLLQNELRKQGLSPIPEDGYRNEEIHHALDFNIEKFQYTHRPMIVYLAYGLLGMFGTFILSFFFGFTKRIHMETGITYYIRKGNNNNQNEKNQNNNNENSTTIDKKYPMILKFWNFQLDNDPQVQK